AHDRRKWRFRGRCPAPSCGAYWTFPARKETHSRDRFAWEHLSSYRHRERLWLRACVRARTLRSCTAKRCPAGHFHEWFEPQYPVCDRGRAPKRDEGDRLHGQVRRTDEIPV